MCPDEMAELLQKRVEESNLFKNRLRNYVFASCLFLKRLPLFAAYVLLANLKWATDNVLEVLHFYGERIGRPHVLARGWKTFPNRVNYVGRDFYSRPKLKDMARSYFSKRPFTSITH